MAAPDENKDESEIEDAESFVFVFDRREKNAPEVKISTKSICTFDAFRDKLHEVFGLQDKENYVITTTCREEIRDDSTWGIVDNGDTLYILHSVDQELCAPAQERVDYLPHYDTIVKGGMYEYYASEGQNPLPYAFAELIDNALAATANNDGPRHIEIRLHFDEAVIYVIDNGKGMTSRQLNNWAIYRLSKFIRKDKRSKVNLDDSVEVEDRTIVDHNLPKSLNSDISYFGVGGKQAIFFIGTATRMISRPRGSKDVHELVISKEEFEKREKNHESIYSGFIRNRKAGDTSHIPTDDETLRRLIGEETSEERRGSFTVVAIQGISREHLSYLKDHMKEWTRQLAHIYHYYLHGPNGNIAPDEDAEVIRVASPFKNIEIQIKLWQGKQQMVPRLISLRDVEDDMQTLFVRSSVSNFEFKAHVEGAVVEGVLRYHPFLYDRETYPTDWTEKAVMTFEDEHDYAISDVPARGRRSIFECYWNGRLIPYTMIDSFEWCAVPKKMKSVPVECFNRVSGVLWSNDMFQVSTNKLTFIDLELKLRDKMAVFTRSVNGQEKRTSIEKEYLNWLRECHELHDKQIHFTQYMGSVVRTDLPKNKQTPWAGFKQVEWDSRIFKVGQMVRIQRTVPVLLGSISRFLLYGDHTGDVYATGGDLEIVQEPRSLYNETRIVPLSKLDRLATAGLVRKYIEEEEAKLPSDLEIQWPEGNQVVNNEKRPAGKTIGDLRVDILNRKGDKISKMPGKEQASRKLLVELKVIYHSQLGSKAGDQVIVSHISQHGKSWPYWFRKMENIQQLGHYTLQLQVVLNESGENMFAGKPLPCTKIHFQVTEAAPEKFSVGMLEGPFRVGVTFNIPLDLQDGFGNPARSSGLDLKPTLESSGLELTYTGTQTKGHSLILRDVVAQGQIASMSGKNFNLDIKIPELNGYSQALKIRLLPGPASQLSVSPEEEQSVTNGQCPVFRVQVQDSAGNPTTLEGRQSVVCKLSGSPGLPSYSMEGLSSGGGTLSGGEPIFLKKMKTDVMLTAKFDVQGSKLIKPLERKIRLVPSGQASEIRLYLADGQTGKPKVVTNGQEIVRTAGEMVDGLKFEIYDEAERQVKLDDKLASKLKVNWVAKVARDLVLQGSLPGVKVPTSTLETKYCQVTLADATPLDVGFVIRTVAGEPNQMRCTCSSGNQIHIGEPLASEIHIQIKDKFGNVISHESDSVCAEVKVTGEGLKEDKCKVTFQDNTHSTLVLKGVVFEGGTVGRQELLVAWQHLRDYVRLDMVAGPPSQLRLVNYDCEEEVVVYNDSKLPHPLVAQLLDKGGNPSRTPDIKIQLTKDVKLKLLPSPQTVKTNKEGMADFGTFSVSCPIGTYDLQPKVFISSGFVISGPKLQLSIQADPTRPSKMDVSYNNKATFIAGETMPEFTVKIFAENDSVLAAAKASATSMKVWKSDGPDSNSLPTRTLSYVPVVKKGQPGTFLFKDVEVPPHTGANNIMFVYYDGKHQLFSNVIHVRVEPGPPVSLVTTDSPGTVTVSNTRNLATRCILRNLKLELRDKFGNHVTKGMNGSVEVTIETPSGGKETPLFVGGKSKNSMTLAGGTCSIQTLALQENSPGKDGTEYKLVFTVLCKAIARGEELRHEIPFLFFNDAAKQSEMAELSKERDSLQNTVRTYKSLFDTTRQLVDELKISVKEAKAEESKIRTELSQMKINVSTVKSIEGVEKQVKDLEAKKEALQSRKRRTCTLPSVLPDDPEVLGKIGQLALISDSDAARVLSWHMSSDMDCVVTMTTKKAKQIYNQTQGKQQVLPLDSIFRKSLTEWNKPLPHLKYRPNWAPPGRPMYARHLLCFSQNEEKCRTVFAMLLGDTLWIDRLDQANDYRKELVQYTNCPTILTREGDRIRSNGKFGGLMNKAPPIDRLRGAVFGEPLPKEFQQTCTAIATVENLRSAMLAHQTAEEELSDQIETMNTPEMKAKYEECRDVEKQLKALEKKLGVASSQKLYASPRDVRRTPDRTDDGPAAKRAKPSPALSDSSTNGISHFNTPTRQSRRIASMTPVTDSSGRKKLKKS